MCDVCMADPVRPKNDKGTILSDSISAVNELHAEIERLKTEQVTLSDESRDVSFVIFNLLFLKIPLQDRERTENPNREQDSLPHTPMYA